MNLVLELSPAAIVDLEEAVDWYNLQSAEISVDFAEVVDSCLLRIQREPLSFPVVHGTETRLTAIR